MAYGVSLWFDAASEARVRALWAPLREAGLSTSYAEGRVRPHLTLSHAGALELPPFLAALPDFLAVQRPFPVIFSALGLFPPPTGALYLAAVPTDALLELQQGVAALVAQHGEVSASYYAPDRWTPHTTLAVKLSAEAALRAVGVAQRFAFPVKVRAERVGVVENPSETELAAFSLG